MFNDLCCFLLQAPLSPEAQPDTSVGAPEPPPLPPPDGHVLYSAQLEEEWMKTGELFEVQVPRKRPTTKINGGYLETYLLHPLEKVIRMS